MELFVKRGKISSVPEKQELVKRALHLMKQNYSLQVIEKEIQNVRGGQYTIDQISDIIADATAILKSDHFTKTQDVLLLHVRRYNTLITKLLNTQDYPDDKAIAYKIKLAARLKKIKNYSRALDAMNQLENILQMTTEGNIFIEINNSVQVNLHQPEEKKSSLDVDKLILDECVEVINFFKKANVTNAEIKAIVPASKLLEEKREVMLIEDMGNNLQGIQLKTPEPVIYQDENSSLDPVSKLKLSLRKIQAKQIQKAGAHLDENEMQLINRE